MPVIKAKDKLNDKVQKILDEFSGQPGALITILQQIQELYGYVPPDYIDDIACALSVFPSQIYGVLTFYSQFRLEPVGENIIRVCHGTACHVRGAESVCDSICEELGVMEGETTADNKFTVEKVYCFGACGLAPVIRINEQTFGVLSRDKAKKVIKNYKKSINSE